MAIFMFRLKFREKLGVIHYALFKTKNFFFKCVTIRVQNVRIIKKFGKIKNFFGKSKFDL